jgi:release factor glutamine methyltransferase
MGVVLRITPGVLVPRSETERLGRAVAGFLQVVCRERPPEEPVRVIDVCCGSGNLTCALAAGLPSALVWATDLTDQCVTLTRRNVEELHLRDRVRVFQGDLFSPLAGQGLEGLVDAVVCNPPYLPDHVLAARPDLRHEPREAFAGGPYGVSIIMRVLREALPFLRPGGRLFIEVGPREEHHAIGLFKRFTGYDEIGVIPGETGKVVAAHGRKSPR